MLNSLPSNKRYANNKMLHSIGLPVVKSLVSNVSYTNKKMHISIS